MDQTELISVISHLTRHEANCVVAIFNSLDIRCVVSGHDASSRHSSLYYHVSVARKNLKTAQRAIAKHRAKVFVESRKCPKCQRLGYTEVEKTTFWMKVFYMGTTLVRCNKCENKFVI